MLQKRRWTIAVCVAVLVAFAMWTTWRQEPTYEAYTNLLVKGSDRDLVDLDGSVRPGRSNFTDADVLTEMKIIRSWPLLVEAATKAGIDLSDGRGIPVTVDGGKEDWIVTITAQSHNAQEAQRLANAVAEVYVSRNLLQNRKKAQTAREFLEKQQAKVQKDLQEASRALRNYQAQAGAVGLDAATEGHVRSLSDAETSLATAIADRDAAKARVAQLRTALSSTNPTIVTSTSIARNPGISKLQEQIADLSVERAALLKEYTPTSSKVRAIEARIAQAEEREKALVRDIMASREVSVNPVHQQFLSQLTEAEGQSLIAGARVTGLQQTIGSQRSAIQQLPQQQYRLAQLQRNVQVAEKTYLAIQDRYQQMRISEQSTLADAEIVEPALLPVEPVSPKPVLNLTLAIIGGLVLGIGVAAIRETLDDKVHTSEDIEKDLALPLLGIVGQVSDPNERSLLRVGGFSDMAEAFRVIRSNVRFIAVDQDLRTVMVTSTLKGEGKSTTAANLAVALAQVGKRVALVDGDLRSPSVHRQFGTTNREGLSSLLTSEATLDEVTRMSDIQNLHLVTSGPMVSNPAELLESERFRDVLEELRSSYDVVIFDAPPTLGVADASVLAGHMDGIILVVASGEVEPRAVRRTVEMLRKARAHLLGATLNKVNPRTAGYYDDYYPSYSYDSSRKDGSLQRLGRRLRMPSNKAGR